MPPNIIHNAPAIGMPREMRRDSLERLKLDPKNTSIAEIIISDGKRMDINFKYESLESPAP